MNSRELGAWGEKMAAGYLEGKGYTVLEMNYRTRFGEIDIVAELDRFIVFAEVKLRKNRSYAHGREYVSAAKQRKIIAAAQSWILENSCRKQPRFDVIEVYAPFAENTQRLEIVHIDNAF